MAALREGAATMMLWDGTAASGVTAVVWRPPYSDDVR